MKFFLALCVAALSSVSAPTYGVDLGKVEKLLEQRKFEILISKLKNESWSLSSDPRLILAYCYARFMLQSGSRYCIDNEKSAEEVAVFGKALYRLWEGKPRTANRAFGSLLTKDKSKWWGYIGVFEVASHTKNYSALNKHLTNFQKDAELAPKAVREAALKYRLILLQQTAEWEKLDDVLKLHTESERLMDLDLMSAQFHLYAIQGDNRRMQEWLQAAEPYWEGCEHFYQLYSEYLRLVKSGKASIAYLQVLTVSNRSFYDLQIEYNYDQLQQSETEASDTSAAELVKIARLRKQDTATLLKIGLTLTNFNKLEAASGVLRLLPAETDELDDFTTFQVLQAWNLVYSGKLDRAKETLATALARSPFDLSANWLRFLIGKKEGDKQELTAALRRLFRTDPSNEKVVVAILELAQSDVSHELQDLVKKIKQRKTLYSLGVQKRINDGAPAQQ